MVEDYEKGKLEFSISFSDDEPFDLITIDKEGVMYFEADESTDIRTYELKICVTDDGLIIQDDTEIITHCGIDALSPKTTCDSFSFTVSDEQREPIITRDEQDEYIEIKGTDEKVYSVSFTDYDEDPLDVKWFVDSEEKQTKDTQLLKMN